MQFLGALFLVLVLPLGVVEATAAAKDHPIGKVVTLLESLQAKVSAEAKDEEKTFTTFLAWCKTSFGTLNTAIAARTADIEKFTSDESSAKIKKDKTNMEIASLTSEIDKTTTANTKAAADRSAEATLYKATRLDFTNTVKAVQSALNGLNNSIDTRKRMHLMQLRGSSDPAPQDNAWALLLMQEHPQVFTELTVDQQEEFTAAAVDDQSLMQIEDRGERDTFPGTNLKAPPSMADRVLKKEQYGKSRTYSFKSAGAMGLLSQLVTDFKDKIKKADSQETFKLSEHMNAQTARTDAIKAATDTKNIKVQTRNNAAADEKTAYDNKVTATSDKAADTSLRKETKADCKLKQSEYDSRYKTRFGEMAAMSTAIKILTKVAKVQAPPKAPPTLLLQVAAALQIADPKMTVMMNLINMQATKSHSLDFSAFAAKIQRKVGLGGTFDAINEEIQKMIFRLIAEQKTEKEHKVWCDKEYYNTNTTNNSQTDKKEDLRVKIAAATSQINSLIVAINDLVTLNHKNMLNYKKATEERKVSKEAHMVTIKDAKDAQDALAQASAALTAFYKESGQIAKESWEAMVQTDDEQDPTTGTAQATQATKLTKRAKTDAAAYTGQGDSVNPSTGILKILVDTSGDFAVMETNCRQAETSDQGIYEALEKTFKTDKAQNEKDIEMKKEQQTRLKNRIKTLEKGHKKVSDSLWATQQYLVDLTLPCISGDSSFSARQKARDDEIVSLKKAKSTLANAHNPTPAEIAAKKKAASDKQAAHASKMAAGNKKLASDKADLAKVISAAKKTEVQKTVAAHNKKRKDIRKPKKTKKATFAEDTKKAADKELKNALAEKKVADKELKKILAETTAAAVKQTAESGSATKKQQPVSIRLHGGPSM